MFLVTMACCGLLLSACGSSLVRGEPPYVKVHSLNLDDSVLVLRLGVRNLNDVPIALARVSFDIELDETELARFDGPRDASVIANGSETLRFELEASEPGKALLDSLERGEASSLAYRLEGSIVTVDEETLPLAGEGRLYPVPGRPGQFR